MTTNKNARPIAPTIGKAETEPRLFPTTIASGATQEKTTSPGGCKCEGGGSLDELIDCQTAYRAIRAAKETVDHWRKWDGGHLSFSLRELMTVAIEDGRRRHAAITEAAGRISDRGQP